MKRVFGVLLSLLLALTAMSGCAAQESGEKVIVTSFYPMYVFTQNVAAGAQGVTVENMADQSVGCLHDYQLQTRDMVTLEGAFALVINGGGMEQFMDKVISTYDSLPVIDAGEGIEMLESAHSGHEHDHEHEEDGVLNAHVWLNPALAQQQIMNIAEGLSAIDEQNAQLYMDNAKSYCERIAALDEEIAAQLAPFAGSEIITFHEAFSYFAQAYDLHIAGLIEHDSGEEPGTRELAETCDLVREKGITALFVEPQYPQKAADTIARETGASVYTLDPMVSGDSTADNYERAMRANAEVFMEALSK